MKNKLVDLNNILFEQLERINDDSLSTEELDKEIKKAKTIQSVSQTIIKNADVLLKGQKFLTDQGVRVNAYETALMLGFGNENKKTEN